MILHGFLLFWPDLWVCFCSFVSILLEENTVSVFTTTLEGGLHLIPLTALQSVLLITICGCFVCICLTLTVYKYLI